MEAGCTRHLTRFSAKSQVVGVGGSKDVCEDMGKDEAGDDIVLFMRSAGDFGALVLDKTLLSQQKHRTPRRPFLFIPVTSEVH